MEKEEIKYSVGDLNKMNINLSKPMVMEFEDIELRKFTLMTGMNGTGKSLIMKMNWILNLVSNYCAIHQDFPEGIDLSKEVTYLFTHSFDNNNFTGTITAEFDNLDMSLVLEEGECTSFNYSASKDLEVGKTPMYLSTETRLVSDIVKYMKFKKLMGIEPSVDNLSPENTDKILSMYKIYDIIFIESYLESLNGYQVTDENNKSLGIIGNNSKDLNYITVDQNNCTIVDTSPDGKLTDLCTLSAGEQSVFIMVTASKILN